MLTRPVLTAALLSALFAAPLHADPLAEALPGRVRAGGLVDLARVVQDLLPDPPGEAWPDLGLPSPQDLLRRVGVALPLEATRDPRVVLAAETRVPVARLARLAIRAAGMTAHTLSYRGVELLEPRLDADRPGRVQLAELVDLRALGSYDPQGHHAFARAAVDALRGAGPSFGQTFQAGLGPDDYAMGAARLTLDQRLALAGDDRLLGWLTLVELARGRASRPVDEGIDAVAVAAELVAGGRLRAIALRRALLLVQDQLVQRLGADTPLGRLVADAEVTREGREVHVRSTLSKQDARELAKQGLRWLYSWLGGLWPASSARIAS